MTKRAVSFGLGATLVVGVIGLQGLGWALSRPVLAQIGEAPAVLNAEAVAFSSQSGSTIHGWLSRAPDARGSILLLPGVRSNRRSMVQRAEFLRQSGYSTLSIDFQATGESVVTPSRLGGASVSMSSPLCSI